MKNKSRFIGHKSCDACGSSDAVGIYEEGPSTCFSCGDVQKNPSEGVKAQVEANPSTTMFNKVDGQKTPAEVRAAVEGNPFRGFKERKIPKTVTEFYGVRSKVDANDNIVTHYYPYGIDETVGYKVRTLPKDFRASGTLEGLFGQSLFNGGKRLVITEGEIDAMSVATAYYSKYQMTYPVVALPGANSMKLLLEQREWVRRFDEVILMLDNDEPGQKAQAEACRIIGVDKVKIAKVNGKDPNEAFLAHGPQHILKAIWDAQPWSPVGILQGEQLWEKFQEREATESVPYPNCLQGVNDKTNGIRFGEVDLFTSGTGSGKSTVIKEIVLHLKHATPHSIGMISLEESPGDTVEKFISMQLNKELHSSDATDEEKREAFNDVFQDQKIKLLDHQGSLADGSLMDKIETLCLMGAKYLILDHLTIAVSEVENNDANAAVDKVMSDLLKTAKKHNVWIGVISHLRKTGLMGKSFEEGKLPSMDDIKGSGSVKQISFQIIAFARNMIATNSTERNTIMVRVLKSRFTGRTGDAGGALYNEKTGRLEYINHEFVAEPEL